MKKVNFNKDLIVRVISGGLGFVLAGTIGYETGKLNSKLDTDSIDSSIVSEYLEGYVKKRKSLEDDIEKLEEEKEELGRNKTFEIMKLVVTEYARKDGESTLYILEPSLSNIEKFYYEYHDNFQAIYKAHDYTEEHIFDFCPKYVHITNVQPLFNYLNDDELKRISQSYGKVTITDLDSIQDRIRHEYQENNKKKPTKKLSENSTKNIND